ANGRDARGRFATGNPGGPGNPFGQRSAAFRTALLQAVTVEDVQAVAAKLVAEAKAGQPWAVKGFFDRCIGKGVSTVELTDAGGAPLGVTLAAVRAAVLEALADLPEAKLRVAEKLKGLSTGCVVGAGGGP